MKRPSPQSLSLLVRYLSSPSTPIGRPLSSLRHRPKPPNHTPTAARLPSPPRRRLSHSTETPPDPAEAFEAATSTHDILSTFKALESHLPPDHFDLGLACLKVGQHLDSTSHHDHETTLSFARRALAILDRSPDRPIAVAMALHLAASVSYDLQRFRDSLGYLNRAGRILADCEDRDEDEDGLDPNPVRHAVELLLANTKTAMGRREEAIVNLRNCLDLKELMFERNSREVGAAYRDLAEAYMAVLSFKEALPLCLTALEIHEGLLGRNSAEVARDRRLLGIVYSGLEEHEKALEQNQLSRKVMKSWGMDSDIANAEIEAANMQIAMGRYDEAIAALKGVAQEVDKDSHTRVLVFILMAKTLSSQGKGEDAKRCLEVSCGILEKREESHPQEAAEGYADIAEIYECANEFAMAIALLRRAVGLFEKLPQEQYAEANASARIGWLLMMTGKVREGIPYLESAAERLTECFGPKHYAVGNIYNNLGSAYMEMERPQSAAQMFLLAKDIMEVSFGQQHAYSITTCQNLANAYDAMGNFDLALEFQKQVVDAWEKHGPTGVESLQAAKKMLEEFEKHRSKQLLDDFESEVTKLNAKHVQSNTPGAAPQNPGRVPSAMDNA